MTRGRSVHDTGAAVPDGNLVAVAELPEAGPSPRLVYTVREVADQLRIGYSTAREHIRTGELRSFKIGGRRLIAGEDLVAFVQSQRKQGSRFDG